MKIQIISVSVVLTLSLLSNAVIAHDPALHKKTAEKPNCAAIKDMDHSQLEAGDPVMQAIMAQCHSQETEAEAHEKNLQAESKTKYRPKVGHETPMLESAPDHERQDHRKIYEVTDCEDMSKMHHSKGSDAFDPITQEMMKQCEKKSETSHEDSGENIKGEGEHESH